MFLFFETIDTTRRVCRGIVVAHVDDLLVCGTGEKYQASMDAISKVVDLNLRRSTSSTAARGFANTKTDA